MSNRVQSRLRERPAGRPRSDARRASRAGAGAGARIERALGNRTVQRLLDARIRVAPPSHPREREAERVAAAAERDTAAPLPRPGPASSSGTPMLHRARAEAAPDAPRADAPADGLLEGLGAGRPLDPTTRARFASRLGTPFADVRVHAGPRAAESAHAVGAAAFTLGRHIVFGAGRYAPATTAGRRLLAHELTHVAQAYRAPTAEPCIHRSAESDAARIESLLSYGIFDWVITDAEAIEALEILSGLPVHLQQAVLRRINLGRLRENLPAPYLPVLERVLARAGRPPSSVRDTVRRIQDLLSYGLFDWAITDADANEAFRLLTSLPPAEQQRVVLVINYRRLYDNLPNARDRAALAAIRRPAVARETADLAVRDARRRHARRLLARIKTAADALTLPHPPASGAFERFLGREYLTRYCARPSGDTGRPAIEQMTREGAGGFTTYGYGLLRDMAARAGRVGIGYIDSPYFLGTPAPGSVTAAGFFDPWSQGPNPTDIMHFAAGIKWHWVARFLVQWYFIHYEKKTEEGWQIFGLDALNDVIAEEGGRVLGEDLAAGRARCSGGFIDLDPYFRRGRAFLRGELSESRLDRLALRVHQPHMVVATGAGGGGVISRPLWTMTVMEQLMTGAPDAAILASPDARILIMLYRLLRRG